MKTAIEMRRDST